MAIVITLLLRASVRIASRGDEVLMALLPDFCSVHLYGLLRLSWSESYNSILHLQ